MKTKKVIKMSYQAISWALDVKGLTPPVKMVLIQLANRHNPDLGCFPSIKKIAEDCEMCKRSVFRHLKFLEDRQLIEKITRFANEGRQTSNFYKLNFGVTDLQGGRVTDLHPHSDKGVTPLTSNNNQVINNKEIWFNNIYEIWPKKGKKEIAKDQYYKSLEKIDHTSLLRNLNKYLESVNFKDRKYVPLLCNWLKDERWNDDLDSEDLQILSTRDMMARILEKA